MSNDIEKKKVVIPIDMGKTITLGDLELDKWNVKAGDTLEVKDDGSVEINLNNIVDGDTINIENGKLKCRTSLDLNTVVDGTTITIENNKLKCINDSLDEEAVKKILCDNVGGDKLLKGLGDEELGYLHTKQSGCVEPFVPHTYYGDDVGALVGCSCGGATPSGTPFQLEEGGKIYKEGDRPFETDQIVGDFFVQESVRFNAHGHLEGGGEIHVDKIPHTFTYNSPYDGIGCTADCQGNDDSQALDSITINGNTVWIEVPMMKHPSGHYGGGMR